MAHAEGGHADVEEACMTVEEGLVRGRHLGQQPLTDGHRGGDAALALGLDDVQVVGRPAGHPALGVPQRAAQHRDHPTRQGGGVEEPRVARDRFEDVTGVAPQQPTGHQELGVVEVERVLQRLAGEDARPATLGGETAERAEHHRVVARLLHGCLGHRRTALAQRRCCSRVVHRCPGTWKVPGQPRSDHT